MSNQFQFELPNDAWQPAEPDAGQLFLALHTGEFPYFVPNISADMAPLQTDATLEDAADVVAARLADVAPDAQVAKRRVDEDAGHALQQVDVELTLGEGVQRRVSQAQVLSVVPVRDSDERMLLCLMLTAETDTLGQYTPDFQAFVESVRPA